MMKLNYFCEDSQGVVKNVFLILRLVYSCMFIILEQFEQLPKYHCFLYEVFKQVTIHTLLRYTNTDGT